MLDTICLKSPPLSDLNIAKISLHLERKIGITLKTGEVFYEFTSGSLAGSYDNRISCRIEDNQIRVECSIHKLFLGHNCFNGYPVEDFQLVIQGFVNFLQQVFEIEFPDPYFWEVKRIDVAAAFRLESNDLSNYIYGLNNATYSRRRVQKYSDESIFFPGYTTSLKIYDKYKEYKKHDLKRLKKFDEIFAYDVLNKSKGILRVEVSIKHRKFKYDFKKNEILVKEITADYLNRIYDTEINRMYKECENMEIVRTAKEVNNRLKAEYAPRLAKILFATWFQLSTLGEITIKQDYDVKTLYRHKKQLKDAGISWLNTDVNILESMPIPFRPYRSSPQRLLQYTELQKKVS